MKDNEAKAGKEESVYYWNDLDSQGSCRQYRDRKMVGAFDTKSAGAIIHSIVENAWAQYKTGAVSSEDEMEAAFMQEMKENVSGLIPCEETFKQKVEDELGCIKRYLKDFPEQDMIPAEAKNIEIFGNIFKVNPTAMKIDQNNIEVIKVFDHAPDISDRGRSEDTKTATSKKLFSFLKYGQEMLKDGQSGIITATFIYLRAKDEKNEDPFIRIRRTIDNGLPATIKDKKIVSMSYVLAKDSDGKNIDSEADDKFRDIFDAWNHGIEKGSCDKCPERTSCMYKKAVSPIPKVKYVRSRIAPSEEQKKVIRTTSGFTRVIASAGSGKTFSIVRNVLHLLEKDKPQSIVVVAYNRDAAEEIKRRLIRENNRMRKPRKDIEKVNVNTFDGLFYNVIRTGYKDLGFTDKPEIIEKNDAAAVTGMLAADHVIAGVDYKLFSDAKLPSVTKTLIDAFDIIKRNDLSETEEDIAYLRDSLKADRNTYIIDEDAGDAPYKAIYELYKVFNDTLFGMNRVEYADLPKLVKRLWTLYPNCFDIYGWRHFIVDEAQDIDRKELEILKLMIASKGRNKKSLLLVGDDRQSIYHFKGADPTILLNLEKEMGTKVKTLTLSENRRSQSGIIGLGNRTIERNSDQMKMEIISSRSGNNLPVVQGFQDKENEYAFIADQVLALQKEGFDLHDMAFIAIKRSILDGMEKVLSERGIPSNRMYPEKINDNPRVQAVYALWRAFENPDNKRSIRIYLEAKYDGELFSKASPEAVRVLVDVYRKKFRVLRKLPSKRKAGAFMGELRRLDTNDELYKNFLSNLFSYSAKGWNVLSGHIENLYRFGTDDTFRKKKEYDGLQLNTVYSMKGLEKKIVFLSLDDFDQKDLTPFDLEERNRLKYVGITRAKDLLFVTGKFVAYGDKKNQHYNVFLFDAYEDIGKAWDAEINNAEAENVV